MTLRSSKHRLRPARFQAAMPDASLRESIARTSPAYGIASRLRATALASSAYATNAKQPS
ncbi:hypothetical protein C0214_27580 (plasmid) [Methylobacterium sp. DM1]|nr:hypothetical protein C0214_27580 [Methylobacterium sp. DM1]